jgi:DNA helicase II / ATP-dependent DNA helicase PcrA
MRKQEIEIGKCYSAKISNKMTTVRIDSANSHGGWNATNNDTGRAVRIKTAAKLRRPVNMEARKRVSDLVKKVEASSAPIANHVIVNALAGTGKTTTIIEGLKLIKGMEPSITPSPQQQAIWDEMMKSKGVNSVVLCCFNKSIQQELEKRVPTGCEAMTMHSMGYKSVQSAFGKIRPDAWRTSNIICEILRMEFRDVRKKKLEVLNGVSDLVSLCKQNLINAEDVSELSRLAGHYGIELNGNSTEVFDLVPQVMERSKDVDRDRSIHFDDMIWLPVALGLHVPKADLLLVDEAQDLNRCQQALAKKAGKRLILVGDPKQAIYGFAGADAESMPRMFEELSQTESGCVMLPLTVTRRCGKAIVEEAKKLVPNFEAHESNGEGKISYRKMDGVPFATQMPVEYQTVLEGEELETSGVSLDQTG